MKFKKAFFPIGLVAIIALISLAFQPSNHDDREVAKKFVTFLSFFEKVDLPYEMTIEDYTVYDDFKPKKEREEITPPIVSGEFKKVAQTFIPTLTQKKFSRFGPPKISPLYHFYPDEETVVIIYEQTPPFSRTIGTSYQMIQFDLKGRIVQPSKGVEHHRGIIALGYTGIREAMTFSLDSKGTIWQNKYEVKWEKDLADHSYLDNQITGFQLVKKAYYAFNGKKGLKTIKEDLAICRP